MNRQPNKKRPQAAKQWLKTFGSILLMLSLACTAMLTAGGGRPAEAAGAPYPQVNGGKMVFNEIGRYQFNVAGCGVAFSENDAHVGSTNGTNTGMSHVLRKYEKNQTLAGHRFLGNSSGSYLDSSYNTKNGVKGTIKKAFLVVEISSLYVESLNAVRVTLACKKGNGQYQTLETGLDFFSYGVRKEKPTDIYTKVDNAENYKNDTRAEGRTCQATGFVDVTEFVQENQYGWYYGCNIPYDTDAWGDNFSSWKLIVIEENPELPIRKMTLNIGNFTINSYLYQELLATYNSDTVKTKSYGTVSGQLLYGATDIDPIEGTNYAAYGMSDQTLSSSSGIRYSSIKTSNTGNSRDTRKENGAACMVMSRNGVPLSREVNWGTHYWFDSSSFTYSAQPHSAYSGTNGNLLECTGDDMELIDVGDDSYSNIKFDNLKNTVGLRFATQDRVFVVEFLGVAFDIDVPEFHAYQDTVVSSTDPDQVTIIGDHLNMSNRDKLGLYNGTLTVNVDKRLEILSAEITGCSGESRPYTRKANKDEEPNEEVAIDNTKNQVVFGSIYSYRNLAESYFSYTITCRRRGSATAVTKYVNSDTLEGPISIDNYYERDPKMTLGVVSSAKSTGTARHWLSIDPAGGTYLDKSGKKVADGSNAKEVFTYGQPKAFSTTLESSNNSNGVPMISKPVKKGYTLTGWKADWGSVSGGTDSAYTFDGDSARDTTITAQWSPNIYTVTLDDNGGEGGSGSLYEKYSNGFFLNSGCTDRLTAGNPVKIPVREGYEFLGYYTSKTASAYSQQMITAEGKPTISLNPSYTSDTTLYARWEEKTSRVTYHSNFQDSQKKEVSCEKTKGYQSSLEFLTLEQVAEELQASSVWSKEDFHFAGWSTDKDAKTAEYQPGELFTKNEDTDLYAVWEENRFDVDLEAPPDKNPDSYYDYSGSLKSEQCDGIWYKDSVTVKASAVCNYAAIRNVSLSDPLNNNEYKFIGPEGQDWHEWKYAAMDVDKDGVTDEAITVRGQGVNALNRKTKGKIKMYYIDYRAPEPYSFSRTFDSLTGTYRVSMAVRDTQSGLTEAALQSQDGSGSWMDMDIQDYRTYDEAASSKEEALAGGRYTTEKAEVVAKFDSLPVNTSNYNQLYRLAFRDAVGHESYSQTFTLGPELKMKSSIRRLDGTVASAGEELELLQYGDMRCWIDVSTEGYAEQILYVLPACMHLYPGYGSYVQLTEPGQLDGLPMKDSDRSGYQNKFDKFNFYIIPVTSDVGGLASDVFQLEVDESRLELNDVHQISVYAQRGMDFKKNLLKVKYIHKKIGHRIIISQSWQAPIFLEWNGFFSFLNQFNDNKNK